MNMKFKLLFLTSLCASLQACNGLARKLPGSDWPASSGSTSVSIQAQEIGGSGPRPYMGKWGPINGAYVEKISFPSSDPTVAIKFVRHGRSTLECGSPDAVVTIGPGGTTTPDDMRALFGVDKPRTSLTLVACLVAPRRIDSVNVLVHWNRPASTPRSALMASAAGTTRAASATSGGSTVGGHAICKNTESQVPEVKDGLFVCDLEGKLTQLEGFGVLSQIVKNGEIKSNISWDVLGILFNVENDKLRLPEIQAEFRGESASGQVINGVMRLTPEITYEGTDLCHVSFKDVNLNFAELSSPQLSSFVTKSAAIAIENNATLNHALIQFLTSGFMTYVPKVLGCNATET